MVDFPIFFIPDEFKSVLSKLMTGSLKPSHAVTKEKLIGLLEDTFG